jgi:hypothetical protein
VSPDPRRTVLDAYFEGINGERFEEVGALFADDAVLRAPGFAPRRGPAEIAAYLATVLEGYPEHHDEPIRFLIAPAAATVEIQFTGALRDGTPFEFEAVDVFDFAGDGSIGGLRTWYDSNAVLGNLVKAAAAEPPKGDAVALGSLAEATPGRVRAAVRAVRYGRSVSIAGTWLEPREGGEPALVARAVVIEADGAERLDAERLSAAATAAGIELRPGDALIVDTGTASVAIDGVPEGIAAVAVGVAIEASPPGLLVGAFWDLAAVRAAVGTAARPVGLLVAAATGEPVLIF